MGTERKAITQYISESLNLNNRMKQSKPWLYLVVSLLALSGYFGPWIDHKVAGLVVTGLDLGEYVKFLPIVQSGQVTLWREGFYLPLFTISLVCSLSAYHYTNANVDRFGWLVRILLLIVAGVAALNMLPPAWTPARMMTPEFRLQANAILFCLTALAFSPLLALLPTLMHRLMIPILSILSIWYPVQQFWQVLPSISGLYNHPQQFGWGVYAMIVGFLLLGVLSQWTKREQ